MDFLGPALFSSFLIGMLYVTVVNPIGAVTSKRYKAQLAEVFGDTETNFSISSSGIWLHDTLKQGKLIIHGEALDPDAASIINPVIYFYAEDIHVTAIYQAKLIQLTDKGWILDDALRWQNDGQEEEIGSIMLPTGLGTLDLSQSGLAPQSISVYLLPRFISALERAGVSSVEYRFYLYKILSLPLMMVGIAMLAARITLNNVSQRRRMRLFIRGMFLAILIFFFTYFMQIMGISLRVPPEFAALTPAVTIV